MVNQSGKIKRNLGQVARFSAVGVLNTVVDFSITNLLVFLFAADTGFALALISIIACMAGILNSYFWNKRWTFQANAPSDKTALLKFFGVALLSLLINTSVFLFTYHYLVDNTTLAKFSAINLSKLAGVVTALLVSFLGYKLTVFSPKHLRQFRENYSFDTTHFAYSWKIQGLILVSAAAVVRALYLGITTAVFGDAVSYANVAQAIASGQYGSADAFWSNPFCFWEALFPMLGFGRIASAIAASFIPGVLLVFPVVVLARLIYGEKVAWLAGFLVVLHPRLVEYSCNGYSETFYLFFLTCAVMFLTLMVMYEKILWCSLACGVAFGIYVGVRNEGLVPMAACLGGFTLFECWKGWDWLCLGRQIKQMTGIACGFVVVLGVYVAASESTFGTLGLFQKLNLKSKQHLEQLDWHAAAKEAYGSKDSQPHDVPSTDSVVKRVLANEMYVLQRLPGVLLTPMWLFVLLLPLLSKGGSLARLWPLLVMLCFPLLLFPLLQVEPRLLFPILIPIQIFGAAGLFVFCVYVSERVGGFSIYRLATSLILLLSFGITLLRGWDVERNYRVNRALATWIDANVPKNAILVGCGYGYISTTAFLAGHPALPRVWSEDPQVVVDNLRKKNAKWLVLYQDFLKKSNPELLPVLTNGVPGMVLRHEVTDWKGDKVQIYQLRHR